jgi:hypothetical protein
MHIRVATYGFDESRLDEALAKMDAAIRDDLKSIARLESIHERRIGEGEAMIVATYDSEVSAVAARPIVQEIFGKMTECMASPPEFKEGSVIWMM